MPGGRPTLYEGEKTCHLAYHHCLLGATTAELATLLNVCADTIWEWMNVYPEFSEAIKKGKAAMDEYVEQRLFKRATGYEHESVKIFNNDGTPMVVPFTEKFPPDPTSMIFWLKNRKPKEWREKSVQELEGGITHSYVTDKPLTAKEFEEQIAPRVDESDDI